MTRKASRCVIAAGSLIVLSSMSALGQTATPAISCESLARLALPDTTVTLAQPVAAGEFKVPTTAGLGQLPGGPQSPNPPFCRVAATLKPSSDSDIKIEVWLPQSGWNGKFLGVGGGGWAGRIAYSGNPIGLTDAIRLGYAAANTDTGHDASVTGNGGAFAIGHPEKLIDYGYRAVHEMTVTGKAIVAAYYGVPAKHAYFVGCSLGGMQAMVEARRFPTDYDGIVAGAPANPMALFNAAQLWPAWLVSRDPAMFIPTAKYTMIHEAALKACSTLVGQNDGLIEQPDRCRFDPQQLLCNGPDAPDCLTAPQVELMRQIYAGPANPRTKQPVFPGVARDAELQLPQFAGNQGFVNAAELYKSVVFQNPNWDFKTLDFDRDIALAVKTVGPAMHADANLNAFIERGGKLMMYIGWNDYHNPEELITYYNAVLKNAGGSKPASSVRLFLIPGMNHCSGGVGCDTFDKVGPMERWVEKGQAPERIVAARMTAGKATRTRPLCAYPQVAKYKRTGDIDDAENLVCVADAPHEPAGDGQ